MKKITALALTAALLAPLPATAATFIVQAAANSSSGGTGLSTITLSAGQAFTVSSNTNDLWSAGALPRFSDAGGLVGDRFATAADDSGQAVGTQIGTNFGTWTQDGFTTAYGTMVGKIGTTYFALGTGFAGVAPTAGVLELFYWDSNNGDNSGQIAAEVTALASAVPEATTWGMMIAGFGLVGMSLRRRSAKLIKQMI
jgi:hypothetical protein